MQRKQFFQILLPIFLLLPAVLHLLIRESRADAPPSPTKAPVEQLVFISGIDEDDPLCLQVRPARLNEAQASSTIPYHPDDAAPPICYRMATDAEIYLVLEGVHSSRRSVSPAAFPALYRSLTEAGADPIFFMVQKGDCIQRLEYAAFE